MMPSKKRKSKGNRNRNKQKSNRKIKLAELFAMKRTQSEQQQAGYTHVGPTITNELQPNTSYAPKPAFDVYLADKFFNKLPNQSDLDNNITSAILQRNSKISQTSKEQIDLTNLVSKVKTVLENLAFCPNNFNAMKLIEIREVGSYKKSTMLAGHKTADLVIIISSWPKLESVRLLAGKVLFELTRLENLMNIDLIDSPCGFTITQTESETKVRVLVTTYDFQIPEPDKPSDYVEEYLINLNMAACRHARWFEASVTSTSISLLIKIIKDMCIRFKISQLNPWIIDVLCHYSFTYRNPGSEDSIRQPHLPLAAAFKRLIQIISSGILLPGQAGIIDICEPIPEPIHSRLTMEQQDEITCSFQTILRILPYPRGYQLVLGLREENFDYSQVLINKSSWDDVLVEPSRTLDAYNTTASIHKEQRDPVLENLASIHEGQSTVNQEGQSSEEGRRNWNDSATSVDLKIDTSFVSDNSDNSQQHIMVKVNSNSNNNIDDKTSSI